MTLIYALLVGIAMGALIQRAGASSPRMILASLRLENIAIIKFMATTIAVGMLAVFVLNLWMPMHFDIKPTYVLGILVGGLIFGVGFALSGFCPGTCVVGIGEGRRDAWMALFGGVLGALVFTLAYTVLEPLLITPFNYGKVTLATLFNLPTLVVAIAFAALLLVGVVVIPTTRRRYAGQ